MQQPIKTEMQTDEGMKVFVIGLLEVVNQLYGIAVHEPIFSKTRYDREGIYDNKPVCPKKFYRVNVRDLKIGTAIWDLSGKQPRFQGMVADINCESGLTEVFYLTRESEVLEDSAFIFSCCNPTL